MVAVVFAEDAGQASERLSLHPMWREKAADLIREVTWNGNGFSKVANVRAHRDWPLRGSLSFTRAADGQEFCASLSGRTWKVRAK